MSLGNRILSLLILITISLSAMGRTDAELRAMAARMLMVGFKGDSVAPGCDAERYVRQLGVGGIILFDVDLTGNAQLGSRNITTRPRLKTLCDSLRAYAGDRGLLIAADQEGGRVQRLKPLYGFGKYPSARELGKMGQDSLIHYTTMMARELAQTGINVNLAPDVDVHNDSCPVIGRLGRAYSDDPLDISAIAGVICSIHKAEGVLCAIKHFPGHGSAMGDSHYGLPDVTDTWQRSELEPFRRLAWSHDSEIIMTAHIMNRNLDPDYPATLSHATLTDLLRNEMNFDGVILTDDLYMRGIIDRFPIADAVVTAINAGADMLMMGNNISTGYEPDRPFRIVDIIVEAVKDGRISEQRLVESNLRIDRCIARTKKKPL